MNLTEADIEYLKTKGFDFENIKQQVENLKKGTQFLDIVKPASLNDGVINLSEKDKAEFLLKYESYIKSQKIAKFVPASGAATRMFKNLYTYLNNGILTDYIQEFISNLQSFAFYEELQKSLSSAGYDMDILLETKDYKRIISFLLNEEGLNYGALPKGLLSFHKYDGQVYTPIDEHLKEADLYLGEHPNLVFTISENYTQLFKEKIEQGKKRIAKEIDYLLCYQQPITDTIAIDINADIVKDEEDKILMRPGGHGSLINNLNKIDADIVFIKNIDNVVSQALLMHNVQYKKALAGVLYTFQERLFDYQEKIENLGEDKDLMEEMYVFLSQNMGIINKNWLKLSKLEKITYLKNKINRPLRVCGMVENTGEPGGGPFWVRNAKGEESLQIVESSQIDLKNKKYKAIFDSSSYFNPVDLVCALKNYKGEKYDLSHFVDKNSYFISRKSYKGQDILALEHPGLWNGGMSDWNTIFVSVPLETFAPVKMLNDLLKKEHQ